MRVFATSPLLVGILYFRDPTPRVCVVVKSTWRLAVREGALKLEVGAPLSVERSGPDAPSVAVHANDFVPRKARAEIMVVGRAYSAEPSASFPVELALGARIRKRALTVAATPRTTLPLNPSALRSESGQPSWLGPISSSPLAASRARNDWEAWWSDRWVDVESGAHGEGYQSAPADQQTWEPIGEGTALHLHNLTRGGGDVTVTLPAASPWALLVEPRRTIEAAIALPLRLDTLHVDTELGLVELFHRGESKLVRFSGRPDLVVGLQEGPDISRAEVATKLVTVQPSIASEPWPRAPLPTTSSPGAYIAPASPSSSGPVVGGRALGELVATLPDRVIYETRDTGARIRTRFSVLQPRLARDAVERAAFRRDVERRLQCGHRKIGPVIDCGLTTDDVPFFVEVIPRGRTVADRAREGPCALAAALGWLVGVLEALEAIHEAGLIHGALRADVVYVEEDRAALMLTPALRPPSEAPREGASHAAQAPPEIARKEWEEVGVRSDLWFAAALFLHAVSGRPVHDGPPSQRRLLLAGVVPQIPASLASLIDRTLSTDPDRRPASASEMRRLLRETMPNGAAALDTEDTTVPRAFASSPESTAILGALAFGDTGDVDDPKTDTVDRTATEALPFRVSPQPRPPSRPRADTEPPGSVTESTTSGTAALPFHAPGPPSGSGLPFVPAAPPSAPAASLATPARVSSPSRAQPSTAVAPLPFTTAAVPEPREDRVEASLSAAVTARIATAAPDQRCEELAAASLDELSWALAQATWAAQIDREIRAGSVEKLEQLLSALHAEVLRSSAE